MRHLLFTIALLAAAMPTPAADDHGHDHGPSPAAAAGRALPRFAAVSDAFELVGVLAGPQRLVVYLDRFADNAPVTDAKVELDIGGAKVVATAQANGDYEAVLPAPLTAGHVAVTATVTAGTASDLLVGEFDIPGDDAAHAAAPGRNYARLAVWAGAAALGLAAVVATLRRLRNRRASARFADRETA